MARHKSSGGGSTLYGVLAGLLIGLMVAAGVAYYVVKAPSPFLDKASRSPDAPAGTSPGNAPDPNAGLGNRDVAAGAPLNPDAGAQAPAESSSRQAPPGRASDDLGALIATLTPTTPATPPASAPSSSKAPVALPPPKSANSTPKSEARTETPAAGNSSQATTGAPYYLQVGSFKVLEDAETLRARIILMGMPVDIQRAEVNGVQFNRVRVGPFTKIDEMNKTRARLGEEKIPTAVMRQ
jgi:cell division protein FtsN